MTIAQLLEERAREFGAKRFIRCDSDEISFAELQEMAVRVASNLAAAGVGKGDKVVLLMGNCIEFLSLFLGLGRIGAVIVPVNPTLKPPEIAHIVNDSDAETLVTIPEFGPLLSQAKQFLPRLKRVYVLGDGMSGFSRFAELTTTVSRVPDIVVEPGDDAALIYTSGTTGAPKGVTLTHHNYVSNARMLPHVLPMLPHDSFLLVLPLFHVNAQVVSILTPLLTGADVIMTRKFAPLTILPMIEKFQATIMSAVPTIYNVMCRLMQAQKHDISSVRVFASGAAPMPENTYADVEKFLQKPLVMGYGLSEATCASAVSDYRDPIKWNSVGSALRYTNIRIVDANHVDLPVGEVGEIVISGPTVMRGYYKNPKATADVLKDGWLYTGDLGRFDEDGYLYIAGRLKDMIIRGGQNIYPAQVENVLSTMPGVDECAVVGIEEDRWGQEVLAVVKKTDGAELTPHQVIDYCRERLAPYKCPRYVEFVSELPKTATGKIKKADVAGQFAHVAKGKSKTEH